MLNDNLFESIFMNKLYSIVSWLIILSLFVFWWIASSWDVSINFSDWCLTWAGTKCFVINSENDMTVLTIAQDAVLAATYMVWTVLTIVLIYCWLMYIFSSWWWKDPSKYKKWLIYAAIWALLVRWAYPLVRLIQYIAKW